MHKFQLTTSIVTCLLALSACGSSQAVKRGSKAADKPPQAILGSRDKVPEQTAVEIKPANPVTQGLHKDARTALDKGDITGATRSLERALRIDSRDAKTYLLLARLRNTQGDRKSALQLIDKALSLRPTDKTASALRKLKQSIEEAAPNS